MTPSRRTPALLAGIPLDDVTMPEAVDAIGALIDDGRRTGRPHQVTTVNVDFVVNSMSDAGLHEVLQRSSLSLADGMPVVGAGRAPGLGRLQRVAGADLVPALAARAAAAGWRMHFFGGGPGVAERAADVLRAQHPGLLLTTQDGSVGADGHADAAVIRDLNDAAADIVCVALGNPKQERFIAAHGDHIGAPVLIGVGGTLDLLVGVRRRAPRWAQVAGLEWVFRAAQEPVRLGKRYARDGIHFGPLVARSWIRSRRAGPSTLHVGQSPDTGMVTVTDAAPTGGAPSGLAGDGAVEAITRGAPVSIALDSGNLSLADWARVVGLLRLARSSGVRTELHLSPAARASAVRWGLARFVEASA